LYHSGPDFYVVRSLDYQILEMIEWSRIVNL
jgi:hypothetical protein